LRADLISLTAWHRGLAEKADARSRMSGREIVGRAAFSQLNDWGTTLQ
jgi:hypothetical protein